MKKIFLIFIIFNFSLLNAQKENKIIQASKKPVNRDTVIFAIPNVLNIKTISDKSNDGFDLSKNMPWIAAVMIGFTTIIANLIISWQLRKSNVAIIKQQIENAKSIASDQLELSKLNNERDFKKTVLSANRQLWITDFRSVISELITVLAIFSLKQKMDDENKYRFNLLITKAELMLFEDGSHVKLKIILERLKDICNEIMMEIKSMDELENIVEEIKDQTIFVLSEQWERASKAE